MSQRKLSDPVLNDLLCMVQGRKLTNLNPAAVTRYGTHLLRIDNELAGFRDPDAPKISATDDDMVLIARRELAELRGSINAANSDAQGFLAQIATAEAGAAASKAIEDALFSEFQDVTADTTGENVVDVVLELLRRYRALRARLTPTEPSEAPTDDRSNPESTERPGGGDLRQPAARAGRRVAAGGR